MRIILILLLPVITVAQPVKNVTYKLKEVHNITAKTDSTLTWKIDTIKYHVPFEIKFTKSKVNIDGYGSYAIVRYEDRSHEGTRIDHWKLKDSSTITQIDYLMYWEYPMKKKKSRMIYFKID